MEKEGKRLEKKAHSKRNAIDFDFWSPKQREYSFAVSAAQLWSFAKAALGS